MKNMFSFQKFLGDHEMSFLLQPLSLLTIASIFLTFLIRLKWLFQPSHKNFPPSPPKLPIIGNLHQIGLFPHLSFCALAKRHGPLMILHFGRVPVLVVSSADTAREILRTHDIIFADRPSLTPFDKIAYGGKDVAMSPYGEYWRQIKSICVLHLLSNKRVHSFRDVRAEEVAIMIEKIKKFSSCSLPINLSEVLCTLTNDIVSRVALGRKYSGGEGGSKFKELFAKVAELLSIFHVGDYIPLLAWVGHFNGLNANLEKVAKDLDDFLEGVVEEHENKGRGHGSAIGEDKDFVDVLLWVQKENIFGFPIDRVTIKAIILDMFVAGTDTTFTVLEWTMVELLRYPEVMKQVQAEIRKIDGDKSDITEDDLDKLHFLKAVIKETLRLHPPIPLLLPRRSTQDIKIQGYDIAAGTQVFINYWTIGRDPALWDEPEEFRPERFLNSSIDFQGHDFQFIPFGSGRRGCPGIQFAMRVNELALANLLKIFDWSLPDGARGEDLDMTEATGLSIHKKSPLIALATTWGHQ